MTLQLLWLEYLGVHSNGYRYSHFCEHYRRFAKRLKPSMRQVHRAGEKAFVDFSGKKPSIVDPKTGEVQEVELFVGVLGASSYVYAEALPSQQLPMWIAAHVRMLAAFGGCPAVLVPDYVAGHIIRVMFRPWLCCQPRQALWILRRSSCNGEHNDLQRTQPSQHRRVVLPDLATAAPRRRIEGRFAGT